MDDLISRQAVLYALKGLPTWWADEGGYYGGAQPPMVALLDPEDAVSAIENLPSAQPATNCSEIPNSSDDTISRQAALDAIMGQPPEPHYPSWYAAQIEKLPAVQPEQRWIPCSERLPCAEYGESDNVLATCGYRDVEDGSIRWIKTLYFNGGNWCHPTGETYLEKVYAWMPLPEPYRGGEKE